MVIMISGKAETGKTTFAELLVEKFKKSNEKALIVNFADYLKFICRQYLDWDGQKDEKGRGLLQYEGTDYVRARDVDFWTKSAYNFINIYEERFDHFLIADTRFKSEVEFFKQKDMNPMLIRLHRPGHENSLTQEARGHASEIDLDDYKYDRYFEARDIKELKDVADIFYTSTKTYEEALDKWINKIKER